MPASDSDARKRIRAGTITRSAPVASLEAPSSPDVTQRDELDELDGSMPNLSPSLNIGGMDLRDVEADMNEDVPMGDAPANAPPKVARRNAESSAARKAKERSEVDEAIRRSREEPDAEEREAAQLAEAIKLSVEEKRRADAIAAGASSRTGMSPDPMEIDVEGSHNVPSGSQPPASTRPLPKKKGATPRPPRVSGECISCRSTPFVAR